MSTEVSTTEEKVSKNGSLVISENPEVFGGLSDGFEFVKSKQHRHYMQLAGLAIAVVILIPFLFIGFRAYVEFFGEGNGKFFLDAVKILFIYSSVIVIAVLIAIPFIYSKLQKTLVEVEEVALFGRDFALFNLPIYRQQLVQLNEKLKGDGDDEQQISGLDIAKELLPVVRLLMAKEKNLLKWGMSGFKALKKLKSFFEGKS